MAAGRPWAWRVDAAAHALMEIAERVREMPLGDCGWTPRVINATANQVGELIVVVLQGKNSGRGDQVLMSGRTLQQGCSTDPDGEPQRWPKKLFTAAWRSDVRRLMEMGEAMANGWSEPTSWSEACQRSSGRRAFNKKRQMAAALRRGVSAKHLRQTGLQRGIQAELSRMLQVSKSTISQDMRRLLTRSEGRASHAQRREKGRPAAAGRQGRSQREERIMARRLTVRLDQNLYQRLQTAARLRHTSLSAIGRLAMQTFVMQAGSADDQRYHMPQLSAPPDDAWERCVMALPPEVLQAIRQAVTATELPLGSVLKALIITACQPKTMPQSFMSPETLRLITPQV
jgi:hypothetical protein